MNTRCHILITTKEQLYALFDSTNIDRIYVDCALALKYSEDIKQLKSNVYLAGPYILREEYFGKILDLINLNIFKGILVRNIETYALLNNNKIYNLDIVLDSGMYILNNEAYNFYLEAFELSFSEFYNSLELNSYEIKELRESIKGNVINSQIVYGYNTLMVSANCVKKTLLTCNHNPEIIEIDDRLNKHFYSYSNCEFCYNTLFNQVPLSLHKNLDYIKKIGNYRLDFTIENADMMKRVIDYFTCNNNSLPYKDFTNGLYKRGVL